MSEGNFTILQKGMAAMFNDRAEALKKLCPDCGGKLESLDIAAVKCIVCDKVYAVKQILEGTTP